MADDDVEIPGLPIQYPAADISPGQFENWVVEVLNAAGPQVEDLQVILHDRISGVDGTYDLDATVRYRWAGMKFVVLVEAKLHSNPIRRDVVQVLHTKVQSVGAHKGVLISTARFQKGAMTFAAAHGIALVHVTEERFTYVTRAVGPSPILSREQAAELGLLPFIGYCYGPGDSSDSITVTAVGVDAPDNIAEVLLGVPSERQ